VNFIKASTPALEEIGGSREEQPLPGPSRDEDITADEEAAVAALKKAQDRLASANEKVEKAALRARRLMIKKQKPGSRRSSTGSGILKEAEAQMTEAVRVVEEAQEALDAVRIRQGNSA
jgi:hypothetical protein